MCLKTTFDPTRTGKTTDLANVSWLYMLELTVSLLQPPRSVCLGLVGFQKRMKAFLKYETPMKEARGNTKTSTLHRIGSPETGQYYWQNLKFWHLSSVSFVCIPINAEDSHLPTHSCSPLVIAFKTLTSSIQWQPAPSCLTLISPLDTFFSTMMMNEDLNDMLMLQSQGLC